MTIDLMAVAEIAKDKIGRKEILGLATLGCLTYLIAEGVEALPVLLVVAGVGVGAIGAQLAMDWKRPRDVKQNE